MKMRSSPILGLVIAENEIVCAQVFAAGGATTVQKVGRFKTSEPTPGKSPQETGKSLAAFLQQHGFSPSRAVIGVPTRWLLSQEKELPPTNKEEATAILRLQAERLVMADNTPTAVDFAGETDSTKSSRVLLVAMLQSQLDGLIAMAEAAGLTVVGVTSTSLATARLLNDASDVPLVMLGEKGAEVVAVRDGTPRALRYVPVSVRTDSVTNVTGVASELRRALAMTGGATSGLVLWNGAGLSTNEIADLSGRMKVNVHAQPTLDALGTTVERAALNGASGGSPIESYIPAIALAMAGTGRARMAFDFAHPRLALPAVRRFGRRAVWTTILVVLAVAGLATLYTTVQQREAESAELDTQLKVLAADIKAAESNIDRVSFGRTYFEGRPPYLEALREVSMAFDYEEPIWTTSFSLKDNRKGQIQGKTTNEQLILTVLDRIRANKKFANVQLLDSRAVGGRSAEWSFSIVFNFVAVE